MLDWRTPQVEDLPIIRKYMEQNRMRGNDAAAANLFLLREKYNIKIAMQDGFLFRKYSGNGMAGRDGLAYPLGDGDLTHALELAKRDRMERQKALKFIYLTEDQGAELVKLGNVKLETDRGNTDYLYTAEHLAELAGRNNQKKRNHVKHFTEAYPDCNLRVQTAFDEQFCKDIVEVEENWFDSREERVDSSFVEREEIYEACNHWEALRLIGAVVYTGDGTPVAMSIASKISDGVFDIHFEKSYEDYARDGGFAFINQRFAACLRSDFGAEWINREEDIGLEGLRRAKMSYHPDQLLQKYHCVYAKTP